MHDRRTVNALLRCGVIISVLTLLAASGLSAQIVIPAQPRSDSVVAARGDSISIRLVDVDLRVAVQALGRYLDKPVLYGASTSGRVTLETPHPVPRSDALRLMRGLVESQGLELVADSGAAMFRIRAKEPPRPVIEPPPLRPAGSDAPLELFVIRLRHARAADVAATVNALYGRASALGELGQNGRGGPGQSLADGLRNNIVPPQSPVYPGMVTGAGAQPSQQSATLTGETTIVPDPGTNSLLVRAKRQDFALIKNAVDQLDVRPLQVLIEVLIAEVRRDRSLSFGVDFTVPVSDVGGVHGVSAGGSQTGGGLGDFVLQVMRRGSGLNLDATLRAAASRGDARILSRPVVIAANNENAEILVGSQRPFIQVSRSLPTEAPSRDQVVQYKDVGTRLTVRPTISADGYVSLQLTQEVNSATTETQFDAPIISTRTVSTHVLVRDSQTVVLGGLADRQHEVRQSGIPFLSAIPGLGGLFGHASRQASETEFFLFITPRIIRSDDDADRATDRYESAVPETERRSTQAPRSQAPPPGSQAPGSPPPGSPP